MFTFFVEDKPLPIPALSVLRQNIQDKLASTFVLTYEQSVLDQLYSFVPALAPENYTSATSVKIY